MINKKDIGKGAIMPLDKESKENLKEMKFKLDKKRKLVIIDDDMVKGRFIK